MRRKVRNQNYVNGQTKCICKLNVCLRRWAVAPFSADSSFARCSHENMKITTYTPKFLFLFVQR